ncbi:MAG: glycoside hydrolase family 31 protein [Paludibacter sp.]|nr:glycoside hydrolase family 31 protein [Paludibacter sp.]
MKKIVLLLVILAIVPVRFTAQTPGNINSHQTNKNEVVFTTDNNIVVSLKFVSPGIIRIWYETGSFQRNNTSFAVINESVESVGDLNVNELAGSYVIYTSELILRINKAPFQLRIFDKYQKLLLEDYQQKGYMKEGEKQTTYKTLRPNEQFFGLGEKSGSLNRRGQTFRMWNSDRPCYGVNEDPLYKSIPFFMSNYGYGIFFDNTFKSEFDFGSKSDDYYSFSAPGGEMLYYFIFGPTYKKIIQRYTDLTGKPIMPPAWALGFAQCRGLYTREDLAREVAAEFRKRQIPCDIIYQDIGWTQHLQDFEWRKENYSNPAGMVADLASQGFKMIVSQDPVISQNNVIQWKEADSLGYFVKDIRTGTSYDMPWPWGGNCGVVDFTKPEVADWWGEYQQKVIDDGVKGFWTDMGEPAWSNEEDVDRLFMKHHAGMHDEIHNVYGLTWDKVVTEQFEKKNPGKRVFQMTRAAYAGMQRYTFGWSGDSGNGNDVNAGWNLLAAQLPLAQSAGMGLIPFWTTDISGYCGDITDREAMAELYIRWMQFGVFNPLSRAHHEGNNAAEPWTFGEEAEKLSREAIELKYKLHPYFYTTAREAYDTGLPLIRALLLEYPDDSETANLNEQFLLGSNLLVAPVVEKETSAKRIYLPQGEWIDYNDGKTVYKGKQWINYPVSLKTIPLFVKKGSVVPEMPVQQFIGEKKNTPVLFNIYPAAEGRTASYELYEDDDETNGYKLDIFSKTTIRCTNRTDAFEIELKTDNHNGFAKSENRKTGICLRAEKAPKQILVNGKKIKSVRQEKIEAAWYDTDNTIRWYWNKSTGVCHIQLPSTIATSNISIIK